VLGYKTSRREGRQCYFLKEESHTFGITGALEGRSEQSSYSVRKVTLPFKKMQFTKCRQGRQVGIKSLFLNSFNPKRQCSPSYQSTKSRGLGRDGDEGLYPKHRRQPLPMPSPVLASPTEAKAVPHSQRAGPCPPLLQVKLLATCISPSNLL